MDKGKFPIYNQIERVTPDEAEQDKKKFNEKETKIREGKKEQDNNTNENSEEPSVK